ncbi:MAG: ATP-binding cassette domain-containing protein, partial [Candidatus Electrothrix sp. AW2]|nr:ATP-binding cassette domain-containing protein [Candidatus Electrothrix gigas]
LVGLTERANDRVETYAGGMRTRLDIACALLHRPQVLFLDEPTLGLDIQTRQQIWQYVRRQCPAVYAYRRNRFPPDHLPVLSGRPAPAVPPFSGGTPFSGCDKSRTVDTDFQPR